MPVNRRVARFNRLFANHIIGPVLTRMPGFGTVLHRGRKSGREYRTPVRVFTHGRDYVVTLPYGPGSDWVRNVLAAGGCALRVRGRTVPIEHAHLAEDDGSMPVPAMVRRAMARLQSTKYLVLTPARGTGEPQGRRRQRGSAASGTTTSEPGA